MRGRSASKCFSARRAAVLSSISVAIVVSILREVVLALIAPRRFLRELHQEVVREGRRADAEEVRSEPGVAQRFLDEDEEMERLLRSLDAACGLHADAPAGRQIVIADGLEHDEDNGRG